MVIVATENNSIYPALKSFTAALTAVQAKQQHDQYMQSLAATQQVVIDLQRLITGHIVTTSTTALTGRPAGETVVELAPALDARSQDGAQPEGVAASNGHHSFRRSH